MYKLNHLANFTFLLLICLFYNAKQVCAQTNEQLTTFAQWEADCINTDKKVSCICWMNKARLNPPDMAAYIAYKKPTESTKPPYNDAISMLKGAISCPPPKNYKGVDRPKNTLKFLDPVKEEESTGDYPGYKSYAKKDMPELKFDKNLAALGKYHFDIGMADIVDENGKVVTKDFGHTDDNGHGDLDKAGCIYNSAKTLGTNVAAIYRHGVLSDGFEMFLALVSGFSHVRPVFNVDNDWNYIGIHEASGNGDFVVIYSTAKPVEYTDKCGLDEQKAGLCPTTHLPDDVKSLPACNKTEEVKKSDLGNSLAAGKKCEQSTTDEGGIKKLANDTDKNGNFSGGSVTHTESENKPWWYVDLGAEKTIYFVDIYNRSDCCQDRLIKTDRDVYISISNNENFPSNSTHTYLVQKSDHKVWNIETSFPTGIKGQYVRVLIDNTKVGDGKEVMSLAEVEVFGK